MTPPRVWKRYRGRACGAVLPAWIPVPGEVDGAMLLHHLRQRHPDQVGHYLAQLHRDEDITPVALQAYEEVEEDEKP
jgi:hypothetical protein